MGEKTCTKCGNTYPETSEYFGKQIRGKNGLNSRCRLCLAEGCKQWHKGNSERDKAYRDANKNKKAEYEKRRRINNPSYHKQWCEKNKEALSEYRKMYNKSNKEVIAKNHKAYRNANKDVLAKNKKLYYEANKEKIAEKGKLYRVANNALKKARDRAYYETHREDILKYQKQNAKDYPEKRNTINQRRRTRKRELPSTLTDSQWNDAKIAFDNKCCYCGKEKPLAQEHFLALHKLGEHSHLNIIPACQSCNSSKGSKAFSEWYPTFKFYSKKREQKILKYLNYKNGIQQLALL